MDLNRIINDMDGEVSAADWCISILEVLSNEIESDRELRPGCNEKTAGVIMVRRSNIYLDCISAVQHILYMMLENVHDMALRACQEKEAAENE